MFESIKNSISGAINKVRRALIKRAILKFIHEVEEQGGTFKISFMLAGIKDDRVIKHFEADSVITKEQLLTIAEQM